MTEDHLKPTHPGLTELQLKCLEGFWNRCSAKQIAADLGISEAWVNKNLLNARRTLHVNSSAEAASLVFGGSRGSIKRYYYQETDLPQMGAGADQALANSTDGSIALVARERELLNNFGPWATVLGIVGVALASIIGVTLLIDAGDGLYQLWKALGY